jgi:hypothetical protein
MENYFKKIGIMHNDTPDKTEDPSQLMNMWKYGKDYPVIDVSKINGKTKARLAREAKQQRSAELF